MPKNDQRSGGPVWGKLEFEVLGAYDVGHLPEAPGLYLFAAADLIDGVWIPLYIGQTGQKGGLRERIGKCEETGLPTHEDWQETMERAVLGLPHVHYRIVRSAAERSQHECRIWNDYRPEVNKIAPPGYKRQKRRLTVEPPEIGMLLAERLLKKRRD